MIKKRWIIIRHPQRIPKTKQPLNTDNGLLKMLKELMRLYPDAQLTVIRLTYDDRLWVDDGYEFVATGELFEVKENG